MDEIRFTSLDEDIDVINLFRFNCFYKNFKSLGEKQGKKLRSIKFSNTNLYYMLLDLGRSIEQFISSSGYQEKVSNTLGFIKDLLTKIGREDMINQSLEEGSYELFANLVQFMGTLGQGDEEISTDSIAYLVLQFKVLIERYMYAEYGEQKDNHEVNEKIERVMAA